MPVANLSHPTAPRSLSGRVCVDHHGAPRFWSTIFNDVIREKAAPSTELKRYKAIDELYQSFERSFGRDCLDRLLSEEDFSAIEEGLMAYHAALRQQAAIRRIDNRQSWHHATTFVIQVLKRAGVNGRAAMDGFQSKLYTLENLNQSLSPAVKSVRQPRLRALPAAVLEDVLEITDPSSTRNPFFFEDVRFRNANIVALGLEGLRLSEKAGLRTDALKFGTGSKGQQVAWINIVQNDLRYEARGDVPMIKNEASVRQVPLRMSVAEALLHYEQNYRGDCMHPYLFSSREGLAIGRRTISYVFETISKSLSAAARSALATQGRTGVTDHDLRHTAAVVLLQRLKDRGETIEDAAAMLRVRFGWKEDSTMPSHYGRAFFEGHLEVVLGEVFEDYVATIRKVRPFS